MPLTVPKTLTEKKIIGIGIVLVMTDLFHVGLTFLGNRVLHGDPGVKKFIYGMFFGTCVAVTTMCMPIFYTPIEERELPIN